MAFFDQLNILSDLIPSKCGTLFKRKTTEFMSYEMFCNSPMTSMKKNSQYIRRKMRYTEGRIETSNPNWRMMILKISPKFLYM